MTNEDLTTEILDKLNWFYDEELNKNRYKNTKPVIAGELISNILKTDSIEACAKLMGFSYKVIYTVIERQLVPVFGHINGGEQTWNYTLTHYVSVKCCQTCRNIRRYTEYHLDSSTSRGVSNSCKICRIKLNASQYSTEITKTAHQNSYDRHTGEIRARQQLYKGQRSLRVPPWYDEQRRAIEQFYADCPEGMQVDHEYPLKGKLVSGLHVIQNLQYLYIEDNLRKGNKWEIV